MNQPNPGTTNLNQALILESELKVLIDLEQRLRGLTEFDAIKIHINRSGDVIDLDPVAFAAPLVNKVRENIKELTGQIEALIAQEYLSLRKQSERYDAKFNTEVEPAKSNSEEVQQPTLRQPARSQSSESTNYPPDGPRSGRPKPPSGSAGRSQSDPLKDLIDKELEGFPE